MSSSSSAQTVDLEGFTLEGGRLFKATQGFDVWPGVPAEFVDSEF